jgi:predicted dehydrogenase
VEARFFGAAPGAYEMPFPEIDRNLIAIETADLLDAIREQRRPEVAGEEGLRAVAAVMALLESAHSGVPVTMDGVLSGRVRAFQDQMESRGS